MPESIVPVVDVGPFRTGTAAERRAVAAAVDRACREIGFIVVAGHGVPDELVSRTFAMAQAFFALPEADKRRLAPADGDVQRGYIALGAQAVAYTRGGESPPDLNERFRIGRVDVPDDAYHGARRARFFMPNVWPDAIDGFEAALRAYYREMETLSATLMRIFAVALDLPEAFFDGAIDRHITAMSAIHYPPQPGPPEPGQLRAGTHTDYGSLTVLKVQDGASGLQVHDAATGRWRDVLPVPGAFIVNIGDLMAQWTNDRWVSTLHRVVNPPEQTAARASRLSLAFFHQPNEDAHVECLPSCRSHDSPPKYAPTTSGEHLMTKIRKQRVAAE
jgi:isopenicillin N synthase-like dioxygenase